MLAGGVALVLWVEGARGQPVTIPDAGLLGAICEALGVGSDEITVQTMAQLTGLDAHRRDVADLEGLGWAVNLKTLDLSFNALVSARVPAGLGRLERLNLQGNGMTRLELASDLKALRWLGLNENQLADLGFLAAVPELEGLELEYNDLAAPNLPAGMTNLLLLNLAYNRVSDLAFLNRLPRLEVLNLDDNGLRSVELPTVLSNLTTLTLGVNRLTNFAFLSAVPSVQDLDLAANRPATFDLPRGLTNLTTLNASENRLTGLRLPVDMTNLVSLSLYDNALVDVDFLEPLQALMWLDLGVNGIERLMVPPGMSNLARLDLRWNPLGMLLLPEWLAESAYLDTILRLPDGGVTIRGYPVGVRMFRPKWVDGVGLEFDFEGPPGVYEVLRSADLRTWVAVGEAVNEFGQGSGVLPMGAGGEGGGRGYCRVVRRVEGGGGL
jgi:internalin A